MALISHADLGGREQVEFPVTISKVRWDMHKNDKTGKESIILALTGTTKDGRTAEAKMWMNNTPSTNKKYPGMTEREVCYQRCYELGMEEPFSPHKVDQLIGQECIFVMEPHSYTQNGEKKQVAQVKFINTFSRPSLSTEAVIAKFDELFGETFEDAPAAAPAAAASEPETAGGGEANPEDLPF